MKVSDLYICLANIRRQSRYDIALTYLDEEQAGWRATLHRKRGQVLQKGAITKKRPQLSKQA